MDTSLLHPAQYLLPILGMLGFACVIAGGATFVGRFLGPRNLIYAKTQPYECGVPVVGQARDRISVKYYLVAILFLLFDLEVAFLLPIAVAWKDLSSVGVIVLGMMAFFMFFFLLTLWYELKVKALEWER